MTAGVDPFPDIDLRDRRAANPRATGSRYCDFHADQRGEYSLPGHRVVADRLDANGQHPLVAEATLGLRGHPNDARRPFIHGGVNPVLQRTAQKTTLAPENDGERHGLEAVLSEGLRAEDRVGQRCGAVRGECDQEVPTGDQRLTSDRKTPKSANLERLRAVDEPRGGKRVLVDLDLKHDPRLV
jgi:hypothetical protein